MLYTQPPDKYRLVLRVVLIFCLIISTLIGWWILRHGFILTPDSYHYLSAAKSFKEANIFLNPDGSSYTHWPPLFPFILSLVNSSEQAMIIIYVGIKIGIGLLVYFLTHRFLNNYFTKIIYLLTVLLSVHLLLITVFLWSEIIFLALLLLHVYATLLISKSKAYYYLLILSGFLLCLQRNAGVFWIVSTTLWFLTEGNTPLKKRLISSVFYFISSSAGLACWYIYNLMIRNDHTTFERRQFFADIFLNIKLIISDLGHTFFPLHASALLVGILILGCLMFYWYRYFRYDHAFNLIMLGIVVYTAGFITLSGLTAEAMERFFAVILPLFLLLPFKVIEHLLMRFPTRVTVVRIGLIIWLLYPIARMGKNALYWNDVSHGAVSDK